MEAIIIAFMVALSCSNYCLAQETNFKIKIVKAGEDFIQVEWERAIDSSQTLKKQILRYRIVGEDVWSQRIFSYYRTSGILTVSSNNTYELTMNGGKGSSKDLTSNTIEVKSISSSACFFDNCKTCEPYTPDKCKTCADGFARIIIGKKGSKKAVCNSCKMENCNNCVLKKGKFKYCKSCGDGYVKVDGKCKAITSSVCDTNGDGFCKWCSLGYYKNYDGTCKKCIDPDCDYCLSGGPCLACKIGFVLKNKICAPQENAFCDFTIDGVCKLCSSGYYLKDGTCTACSNKDENCDACNSDGSCHACKINYEVNDGACILKQFEKRSMINTVTDFVLEKRTEDEEESDEEIDEEAQNDTDGDMEIDQTDSYDEDENFDTFNFEPKDSWGFEDRTGMGEDYYMEVEVQVHVSQTTYMHYLANTRNNHKYALEALRERYMSAYNFLGWGLNRLIYDDEDEKKIFVSIVPWEIMIYMDNNVLPITVKPTGKKRRTTDANSWHLKSLKGPWIRFLKTIKEMNGAVADIHYYATKSGLAGPVGAAIKTCCFGLAIGNDSPGGLVGHELGHNLGMPDNRGNVTKLTQHGAPGSYYSKHQVTRMKRKLLKDQIYFKESVCEPIRMEDGRIIGRVNMKQGYYYGDGITRTQVCKWFLGDECEESEDSKNADEKACQLFECTCNGEKKTYAQKFGFRGMECGGDKRCSARSCRTPDKYDWRKEYSVSNAECSNAIDVGQITDATLVKNYSCIDDMEEVCLYGETRWKELIFPSA